MMPQSTNFDPPDPIVRPLCSSCGWTMWIARIEPHEPDREKHIYKCEGCEVEEFFLVKM